jgi:hypothetical protein
MPLVVLGIIVVFKKHHRSVQALTAVVPLRWGGVTRNQESLPAFWHHVARPLVDHRLTHAANRTTLPKLNIPVRLRSFPAPFDPGRSTAYFNDE